MSTVEPANLQSDGSVRPDLLRDYAAVPKAYDELLSASGPRPHWQEPLAVFQEMDPVDRANAREAALRILRENGVTYVPSGQPQPTDRPWELDLFPQVIGAEEWRALEAGLRQRARLLNAIVADLYGPQRLLQEGVLPPALVYGNPQFLRPCHGIATPGGQYLHFLAFDLARGPDGRWWVLSDRTQAPTGAGFALENRVVASRCLPELFAGSNVQRLASFFRDFSESLLALSRRDDPLVVVLSPGPGQATYFEHAFLARYLGFTIVEGADLTVRDKGLFLKTISGLRPVDVVLRRVDSALCDPLELQTDSQLGVPGLVQAAREGQVTIANALGSGVVENQALLSFLPSVSRFLHDEDLALPNVATWWCGQEKERRKVLKDLDRMLVRRVYAPHTILTPGHEAFIGPRLDAAEREALVQRIEQQGQDFVGQELVQLSTTPVWSEDDSLRPAPMKLRVYLCANGDDYRVMPGGLTRVYLEEERGSAWVRPGDFSKDTWVLSEGPADTFSLLKQAQQDLRVRRSGRDLPSRAGDNLFWLGRYIERSEEAVRLLRSLVIRLSGEGGASADPITLEKVVALLVSQSHLSSRRARRTVEGGFQAVERELWTILFDPDCPDGLARILGNAKRTAGLVRERLSLDSWQLIRELSKIAETARLTPGQELDEALHLLNRMVQCLAAFSGMVLENMTRGSGWRFLDMGRRLERVANAANLLRDLTVKGDPEQDGSLDLLLELADSTMTYRTRYKARPNLPTVLDLLLADDSNPRAAIFQLETLDQHLEALPALETEPRLSAVRKLVVGLRTEIELADIVELSTYRRSNGARAKLDRLLRHLDQAMENLSDMVARGYFSHSLPQQVSGPHWSEAGIASRPRS